MRLGRDLGRRLAAVRELWDNPGLRRAQLAWGGFHAAEWASVVALSVAPQAPASGHVTWYRHAVAKAKPSGAKGTYIERIAITSTMGPGVKVDPASVLGQA